MKKIAMLLFCLPLLFASASIVDASNVTTNVESSAAFKVYVDTFGNNPDFALELCNEGQKYIAAAYTANVSGTWVMVPISKNLTAGSTNTLVYTSLGSGPCYYTPVDSFAFSQFRDFTRTPPVFVSAFPGRIHALISDNADGTGSPDLVPVNYSDGWLVGSYDLTPIPFFTQLTGDVTVNVNSITFQTELGAVTRGPGDSDWGLNSSTGRSMLIALCNDDFGNVCDDAVIANSTADLPVSLSVVGTIDDQNVHHRYVVVDGLGQYICIGTNLITTITPNPASIPYGGSSNVTITVTNIGNVNVTTDFTLQFNVSGSYTDTVNYLITEELAAYGGSTTRNYTFNATGLSEVVPLSAYADSTNQIAECSKADNYATSSITISPVYYLHVWIDGVYNNSFPEWGRPYNVTFYINNSNGAEVPNADYEIIETNGLNPFVPIQIWTDGVTPRGLSSQSIGTATGDSTGRITVTLIPTCNKFYSPGSPVDLTPNIGTYSIIVRGYHNGGSNPIDFAYNGTEIEDYPLPVPNKTCVGPGWTNDKDIINKNTYIFDIYDWMYEVYSITKKMVDPT